jgi:hypothetical protein
MRVFGGSDRASGGSDLPPIRAITRGPKFHWRGYYDKLLFDAENRRVVANEVDFEGRSPRADDEIGVGTIDLRDGDRWTRLGTSRAWNWQQGCMLQWLPGAETEVLWNDRDEDDFVCRILSLRTGRLRTLPHPIYCVSPDGQWGLFPDFRRLNDVRPGYGYAGPADLYGGVLRPEGSGIWRMNLATGQSELVVSLAAVAEIPYTGRPETAFGPGSKHWFNHLLFNTDGSRFLFLHRWKAPGDRTFSTRMFTARPDGRELYLVDPWGRTSHFVWRDPEHIMAWAWHPSHQERFYLYRDQASEVSAVGPKVMTSNGHNTYVPGTGNSWVLNDTYPDRQRLQHPFLYHVPSGRRIPLAHLWSPPEYRGEWRCDLHPCASRDGKQVVLDSTHGGHGRQVYLIEIGDLIRA